MLILAIAASLVRFPVWPQTVVLAQGHGGHKQDSMTLDCCFC